MPTLNIDIEARYAQVLDSLDKVDRHAQASAGRINSVFSSLKSGVAGLAITAAAAVVVSAFNEVTQAADEMGKAAQKVGSTTEALSELKYAADLADVSFEQLQTGLGKLAKNAEQFRDGSKGAAEAFGKIGLDPTKFNDTAELFGAVAEKLSKMEDGARKTAIAQQLLGKSGAELIPLLNAGAAGLKAAADEARRFGIVITAEAAAAAEKFNDNMTRMGTAATGVKYAIGNALIPGLSELSEKLLETTKNSGLLLAMLKGIYDLGGIIIFGSEQTQRGERMVAIVKQLQTIEKQLRAGSLNPDPKGFIQKNLIPDIGLSNEAKLTLRKNAYALSLELAQLSRQANKDIKMPKLEMSIPELGGSKPKKGGAGGGKSDAQKLAEDMERLIKAFEAAAAPAESVSAKLQAQLDAYTALDPALKSYLQGLVDKIRAEELATIQSEAFADEIERNQQMLKNSEVTKYMNELRDAAKNLYEETRTPLEQFTVQMQKIKAMFDAGLIDPETASRAMQMFHERFVESTVQTTDEVTEFWRQAARNMQDAMSEFFFDAMQGKLGDLASSFKATIDRMVANLLASKLMDFLLGEDFSKTGEIGGVVGPLLAKLPSFDVGTPFVPKDMIAKIHQGERILTKDENRAFNSGNSGGSMNLVMNFAITGATDMRSQQQIAAAAYAGASRAARRNL